MKGGEMEDVVLRRVSVRSWMEAKRGERGRGHILHLNFLLPFRAVDEIFCCEIACCDDLPSISIQPSIQPALCSLSLPLVPRTGKDY